MAPRNTGRNAVKSSPLVKPLTTEDILPNNMHIDGMATTEALSLMLANQAHSITALEAALPAIEAAVNAAYLRLRQSESGRLIYVGAGTSARIGV